MQSHIEKMLQKEDLHNLPTKMERCKKCKGWGKDLIQENGYCNHCNRLLGITPSSKRKLDNSDNSKSRKHRKIGDNEEEEDEDDEDEIVPPEDEQLTKEDIERLLAEADEKEVEELDSVGINKLIKGLQTRIAKNQEDHAKYDDPTKFENSEIELLTHLYKLQLLSTVPNMYPEIVKLGGDKLLIELISHENVDMSIETLKLLSALLDSENVLESEDESKILVESLIENGLLKIMIENLNRINDNDEKESNGIYYTLSIIESLLEIIPIVAIRLCKETNILSFLIQNLGKKENDQNKLYSSEILSLLLESDSECRNAFLNLKISIGRSKNKDKNSKENKEEEEEEEEVEVMDLLLRDINVWKKKEPSTSEEEELIENMFDSLCSLLYEKEGKKQFLKLEGFAFLKIIIKQQKYCRVPAFKALDYALLNCKENCDSFIENDGIKYIFPAFMGKGNKHSLRKKSEYENDVEEHIISVIDTLFNYYNNETNKEMFERLIKKFSENDFEKCDRLIELFDKYWKLVSKIDENSINETLKNEMDEEEVAEQIYLAKLNAGLFTMQKCVVIIGTLLIYKPLSDHIVSKCKEQNIDINTIKITLEDYYDGLSEGIEEMREDDLVELKKTKNRILDILLIIRSLK